MERYTPNQIALTPKENLLTLVENRQKIDLEESQLNIFETHKKAERVKLCFSDLVLTTMLRGKKVMQLEQKKPFDYLPGESVIVKGNEIMEIDFPEADEKNPTQCLALVISKEKINKTLERLNVKYAKCTKNDVWEVNEQFFHLNNNPYLTQSLNQLIDISLNENSAEKGFISQLKVEEVLIRLLQTQARTIIENDYKSLTNSPFAYVVKYIKENLSCNLTIDELCAKACMSKASFYRYFTQEFGISPAAFIQNERLKEAKKRLQNLSMNISDVAYSVGFNNLAHFATAFKKQFGYSPKQYQSLFFA
jgi:AraC family transcriptional regulator